MLGVLSLPRQIWHPACRAQYQGTLYIESPGNQFPERVVLHSEAVGTDKDGVAETSRLALPDRDALERGALRFCRLARRAVGNRKQGTDRDRHKNRRGRARGQQRLPGRTQFLHDPRIHDQLNSPLQVGARYTCCGS